MRGDRTRRKAPKPAALTQMPTLDTTAWSSGCVHVTPEQIEVRDQEKGTFVITEEGMTIVQPNTTERTKEAVHRENCAERGCSQCLFNAMDKARDREDYIGGGAQGVVYKFQGPRHFQKLPTVPVFFVRKEVNLDRCEKTSAPVSVRLPSEEMTQLIASAIQGEFHRQHYQSSIHHIVKLYCARLNPARTGRSGVFASPPGTFSMESGGVPGSPSAPSSPAKRSAGSVEFVMEHMDFNLDQLRRLASLIDQRVLNKIVAKFPTRSAFLGRSSDSMAASTAEEVMKNDRCSALYVAALAITMVATSLSPGYVQQSKGARYVHTHPLNMRRQCGCSQPKESPITDSSHTHGVLPEAIVLYIFKQLACALQRLGSYCILHNDIKPSNILVSREGYIKFADFGTSKRGEKIGLPKYGSIASDVAGDDDGFCAPSAFVPLDSTFGRTMSGSSREFRVSGGGLTTLRFRAPELASNASLMDTASGLDGLDSLSPPMGLDDDEGAGSVTGAADVWSLALTMLVLATPNQEGPWPSFMLKDEVRSDVDSNICIASFAVPLTLSDGFSVLLARCMRFKADDRPKPHEIKADIQTLLQPFGKEGNSLKCFCSDDPEVAARNPLTPFVLALQSLTQPKVESDKVSQYLSVVKLTPLKHDAEPADYTQWCTTALRTLGRYFNSKSEAAESGRPIVVSSLPGAGTVPVKDDCYLPNFDKFRASRRRCGILKTETARSATPDTCQHTPARTTRKTFRGSQHNSYRGDFTAKQRFGHYPQASSTLSSTPPSPALCTITVRSPQTSPESIPPIALGKLPAAGVPAALQPAAAKKDPTHALSPEDQSKLFKLKRLYDALKEWRDFLERLELNLEGYFQDAIDNVGHDVVAESLPISLSDDMAELDYPHKRAGKRAQDAVDRKSASRSRHQRKGHGHDEGPLSSSGSSSVKIPTVRHTPKISYKRDNDEKCGFNR